MKGIVIHWQTCKKQMEENIERYLFAFRKHFFSFFRLLLFIFMENIKQCPETMIKHIKIENLSQNMCIQHIENAKSCFLNIKIFFYFLFGMLN
jgi:hypothetical protein